jgi:phosphoribosyl-dephospho-CoA transferase
MPLVEPYRRHDWVWLAKDWRHVGASPGDDDVEQMRIWTQADRPLIVARQLAEDGPGALRLGLALPGKRRVALVVERAAVLRRSGGPSLARAVDAINAECCDRLRQLARELQAIGEEARVFGSFAWQFFASDAALVYITEASDIDLLLRPKSWTSAIMLCTLLQRFEALHPSPRLDGELMLPDGDCVAWREFRSLPRHVLAKGPREVRLRALTDIRALYEERAA